MRRRLWLGAVLAAVLVAAVASADGTPVFAPGSSADGYPPTTHFETSCADKCQIGRAGNAISHVVFLSSEGGKDATIATEQNDLGKSIHYFVAADGTVNDFVPEADTAWYAGDLTYNQTSIGIIVEGVVSTPSSFEPDYNLAAQLVAAISHRYGFPIDAAHVLSRGDIPGTPYTGLGPDPAFDLARVRSLAQSYRNVLDPPPPPPPTDTAPKTTQQPPPDVTAPAVTVSTTGSQKLGPAISTRLSCTSEACTVTGTGSVRVPATPGRRAKSYRLQHVTTSIAQGAARVIDLKLPKGARVAIRRALVGHKRVTAVLTFAVKDAVGNTTTITRRVKLRR